MIALIVFILTYLGLAVGRVPGLALDRAGIACAGGAALLATQQVTLNEAQAAQDGSTLLILFAMMLVSGQVRQAGLYDRVAMYLARIRKPRRLLAVVIVSVGLLSALLTNDVVCVALTLLVVQLTQRARLPEVPFLLAVACASNIGSALTTIGNPQNIFLAQRFGLSFGTFAAACAVPTGISLAILYALVVRSVPADAPPNPEPLVVTTPYDVAGARKAIACGLLAVVLFLSPLPAYASAGVLVVLSFVSRRRTTEVLLAEVDWALLMLFIGLFTVVRGFEGAGWLAMLRGAVERSGIAMASPLTLVPVTAIVSNLISNVPAAVLLVSFVENTPRNGTLMALASTLAGNAITLGSIANLIVIEQARRAGVSISFWQHARVGLPLTALSLLTVVAAAYCLI